MYLYAWIGTWWTNLFLSVFFRWKVFFKLFPVLLWTFLSPPSLSLFHAHTHTHTHTYMHLTYPLQVQINLLAFLFYGYHVTIETLTHIFSLFQFYNLLPFLLVFSFHFPFFLSLFFLFQNGSNLNSQRKILELISNYAYLYQLDRKIGFVAKDVQTIFLRTESKNDIRLAKLTLVYEIMDCPQIYDFTSLSSVAADT